MPSDSKPSVRGPLRHRPPARGELRFAASGRAARIAVRVAVTLVAALVVALVAACLPGEGATPDRGAATRGADRDTGDVARALAPSGRPYSEDRMPCADRDPLRQAFWGELHVHSSRSMDAWLWDVRNGPDAVYRFAKGETTRLPPLDEAGRPTRPAALERPLDFAALTDHASFQGEVAMCTNPGSARFTSPACRIFRGETPVPDSPAGDLGARMGSLAVSPDAHQLVTNRSPTLCGGPDGPLCVAAMTSVWQEQQAAAERHYDRSAACRFSSFHGYEYTATPGLAKVHHNVVFRNARVPETPIAYIDEPDVYGLWEKLRSQCLEAGTGCDVITLPHNSNLSNGHMFAVTGLDRPLAEQRERARLRERIERLAEISQIKGDSECRNGFASVMGGTDEFCDYEEWRGPEAEECAPGETGYGALMDMGCVAPSDYVRHALVEGLRERARLGVNPFKLGVIAATDAHNANPGDAEEYGYQGWQGTPDATIAARLDPGGGPVNATNSLASNPGGLAGVWAEENSRDALFDAMQRRETFGTSGPRLTARFFGGWDWPEDLCGAPDLVARGYAAGVPMGGDLPPRPAAAEGPAFVVSALRDPGIPEHPGGLLQRAQIVKGWLDADGRVSQRVYDVAGGANAADVDPATCTPRGPGHDALCAVWRDPDFDPAIDAVYYLRVLENPSCRWSARQCLEQPADARSPACDDPSVPRTIQERLWTSPIWYEAKEPATAAAAPPAAPAAPEHRS